MVNWVMQPRYWSPVQGYATGDVLIDLVRQQWQVTSARPAPAEHHALLHVVTLRRGDEFLSLIVLDGPAVREIARSFPDAGLPQAA